jgi:hypothetical protein
MSVAHPIQNAMDAAFENYLQLSDTLRSDIIFLLDSNDDSQHSRRNLIRLSASLIEGHVHCITTICVIALNCLLPNYKAQTLDERHSLVSAYELGITKNELEPLTERKISADQRIKLTLRLAFKLFQLNTQPDFGCSQWENARTALIKRDSLMHPKSSADLDVTDELFHEVREGITWLMKQLFEFMEALQNKHA